MGFCFRRRHGTVMGLTTAAALQAEARDFGRLTWSSRRFHSFPVSPPRPPHLFFSPSDFSTGFRRFISLQLVAFAAFAWAGLTNAAETGGVPLSHGFLLVANKGDQTLSIVDAAAGVQVAAVPEGGKTGHEVAASPDGKRAFVPIYGDSGVGRKGSVTAAN